MGTMGSNLSLKGKKQLFVTVLEKLGFKAQTRGVSMGGTDANPMFSSKVSATAPTTNTEADAPSKRGDFCVHYNAAGVYQGVYLCTAYTSATVFTWTKITP